MSSTSSPQAGSAVHTRAGRFSQQKIAPYLFILPFYLLFGFFFLYPSVSALVLSFTRWNGIGEPEFIGLRNYGRMLGDDAFLSASVNTAVYAAASLFIVIPLALIIAVLLNAETLRWKALWRAMYITPVVTSTVAITLVFQILYNKDSGLLNAILLAIGIPPIDWLSDPSWTKVAVILLIIWRSVGLLTIYFLAGLQSIPQNLYEAASIDGANPLQLFRHITVPMLRPIILFVSIIVLLGALQIFDEPQVLMRGGGGPADSTLSLVQYLYLRGFSRLRLGFASAVGTVLFAATFIFSLIQLQRFGVFSSEE